MAPPTAFEGFRSCVFIFPPSFLSPAQSHRLPGGPGLHQVWTGPLLQNTDPLCDPVAAVFGEIQRAANGYLLVTE